MVFASSVCMRVVFVAYVWCIYGVYMAYSWCIYGVVIVYFWCIYCFACGVCSVFVVYVFVYYDVFNGVFIVCLLFI